MFVFVVVFVVPRFFHGRAALHVLASSCVTQARLEKRLERNNGACLPFNRLQNAILICFPF